MTERAVFLEALDRADQADRAAYLDAVCAGEPDLRRRVEELLWAHEAAGGFLGRPAPVQLAAELADPNADDTRTADPDGSAGAAIDLGFLAPSDKPESLGRLGHYEVLEVVGQGGMGVVLRAFDEKLHRVVAVKMMAAPLATSATARKRFAREAQAQAAVSHDHIVTIHQVEDAGPLPYLVMQYVAGQSLQERLDKSGPLQLRETLRIGMQAAAGLAAAHAQGLVHRDIKPANILLENGVERVKITDFGLARAAADASLTQSGQVAGTPAYMSPEQARGEAVDTRTDLFSLGSVLYAMCTGRPPFRAGNSMAVLKRVCEDAPRPIRESNPEVPDWLCAIISKLQAKDPADRYQSAAEVAEVLGRRLAEAQHPSAVPLPAAPPALSPKGRGLGDEEIGHSGRRHRWGAAAVVLVALVAGLGTTEATGLTKFRATVVRIFTPDGTLVVETDDPAVKVVVEGDGDLVITGTGAQEVRLRAGSYKLRATKDGKPVKLDRDLVTITRGDREIVKVRLEGETPAAVGLKSEGGAFVLLGGMGVAERKFDTLAEAVQTSSGGDTIEVRGNGPFPIDPLVLRAPLVIRAGAGFHPVIEAGAGFRSMIEARSEKWKFEVALLQADASLVLEGLEFRCRPRQRRVVGGVDVLKTSKTLHVANCQFLTRNTDRQIVCTEAGRAELRNCALLLGPSYVSISGEQYGPYCVSTRPGARLTMDNCLATAWLLMNWGPGNPKGGSIQLTRSTIRAARSFAFEYTATDRDEGKFAQADSTTKAFQVEASSNLIHNSEVLEFVLAAQKMLPPGEAEARPPRIVGWQGERNVYAVDGTFLGLMGRADPGAPWSLMPSKLPAGLAAWKQLWGSAETGSVEGKVYYQNGDPLSKVEDALEIVTPEDFRLRPDSAGYRAGKDGKDLGADVDLVGPGAAYERWKTTPDYQQWLKDTKQVRAEAPKPEAGAFLVLGGQGVAERKFDTLAAAVLGANAGDTIEVRGNGPFPIDPVVLQTPLVIRAGAGFRPVIEASDSFRSMIEARAEKWNSDIVLLQADAPLVLEGLEFRCRPRYRQVVGGVHVLKASNALHVANCRFQTWNTDRQVVPTSTAQAELRNCEFLLWPSYKTISGESYGASGLFTGAGTRLTMDNCLATTWLIMSWVAGDPREGSIRLTRNTVRNAHGSFLFMATDRDSRRFAEADWTAKALGVEATGNVFHATTAFQFSQTAKEVLPPGDAEACLARMVGWQGERNVYAVDWGFLSLGGRTPTGPWAKAALAKLPAGLAGWKKQWGTPETGSVEGKVHYQNGDPLTKVENALETVTPEDFRLRADSVGYHAGKDGKDLGADVDLVGPGAAYERWKKTPAYQEWLKVAGHERK